MMRPAKQNYFHLSGGYGCSDAGASWLVKEPGPRGRIFTHTERHVQAVWYDPRWRPKRLLGHRGEEIRVESAGTWNLEAGPDFLGATLLVGPERRRISGDVEIHVFPSGWTRHGHQNDRRYRRVCLHVTYFEGVVPDTELPSGALQVALRPLLKADPFFAFEHIDVTQYPYAGRAEIPPCRTILSTWPMDARMRLLDSAGHERLRRKSEHLAGAIRELGVDQVFYESVMTALGYRHNKPPFQALAARLPVELLRETAGGDVIKAYALLLGVSGLMPTDIKPGWDEETRSFVRTLWDVWWKNCDHFPEPLSRSGWVVAGIRPLNHPHRRLAAAACLFAGTAGGLARLEQWIPGPPEQLIPRMADTCQPPAGFYWNRRASWGGKKSPGDMALVGPERWEALAMNVAIPLAAACGFEPDLVNRLVAVAKPEAMNAIIRQCGFYLFGPDAPSALMNSANRRQGIQQVFHDYCLTDRSRCHQCGFPGLLGQFSKRGR